MNKQTPKIDILGVGISNITLFELDQKITEILDQGRSSLICTPNPEFLVRATQDEVFKSLLNNTSKLNLADGIGLLWAAKFLSLKTPDIPVVRQIIIILQWISTLLLIPLFPKFFRFPLRERLSGADIVWNLADYASREKLRVFLLGGGPTVAERTALQLQTKIPQLKIAGVSSLNPEEEISIDIIKKSRADILLVAYGAPKQEQWLEKNLRKTECKLGVGLGGTFDYLSGAAKRAPMWMQNLGLEWLFRLIHEPRRIRRQIKLPYFAFLVLLERFGKK